MTDIAIIGEAWGEEEAKLKVDGTDIPRGANFRYGHRRALAGTDLIVWLKAESSEPLRISVTAAK